MQIRTGAATLMIGSKPGEGEPSALDLRYQGSIVRTARECHVSGGIMTMKVGIEGRVVTGPAGGPGEIVVPLRLAVVQEGPNPKAIVSKFAQIPVTITGAVDRVSFTHIDPDISFPLPQPLGLIDAYVVYVGFDFGRRAAAGEEKTRGQAQAGCQETGGETGAKACGLKRAYHPRRSMMVLFSARMSVITARAPAVTRCWPSRGPAWLPPTKPITVMPAAAPAATPTGESSTTMQSAGGTPILAAACRNRSGAGLPLLHVVAGKQIRLEEADQVGGFQADADAVEAGGRGDAFRPAQPGERIGRRAAWRATRRGSGARPRR